MKSASTKFTTSVQEPVVREGVKKGGEAVTGALNWPLKGVFATVAHPWPSLQVVRTVVKRRHRNTCWHNEGPMLCDTLHARVCIDQL